MYVEPRFKLKLDVEVKLSFSDILSRTVFAAIMPIVINTAAKIMAKSEVGIVLVVMETSKTSNMKIRYQVSTRRICSKIILITSYLDLDQDKNLLVQRIEDDIMTYCKWSKVIF